MTNEAETKAGSRDSPLRVMTYNIRACLGTDHVRSPERIAEVIAAERPDLVALQEVDLVRTRSGNLNQASRLAELLGYRWLGVPAFANASGAYGNAVLSRYEIELVEDLVLPFMMFNEPRSAMRVGAVVGGQTVHLINTHLSFLRRDRSLQIDHLLATLAERADHTPTILCGDLNCPPREAGFRRLCERFTDAPAHANPRPHTTWPVRRPFRRIDHVLTSPDLTIDASTVCRTGVSRRASDHCPLIVDLRLPRL